MKRQMLVTVSKVEGAGTGAAVDQGYAAYAFFTLCLNKIVAAMRETILRIF